MTASDTTPTASSAGEGVADPVIRDAQARSLVSFNTTRLIDAAETLVEACMDADAREELDMEIDGSMMDAVNEAIRDLRAALQPHPGQQAGTESVEFELFIEDGMVAGASGPREFAEAEIRHYAAMYAQDFPQGVAMHVEEIIRIPRDHILNPSEARG